MRSGESTRTRKVEYRPDVLRGEETARAEETTVDHYETVPGPRGRKGADGPEVHRLVDNYDAAGLRAHLKANPKDVNLRGHDGDTPLHVVADKGAVILAELLDEFGADHLAMDRNGLLAGHRAAEGHPNTAAFLFDRAKAANAKEASVMSPQAVTDKIAAFGLDDDDHIDDLAAELCGMALDELNKASEVVKNRTHFEAVKGTILEQKSEGWWQAQFGPQRVRSLLSAIALMDKKGDRPAGDRALLIGEVSTQLDLIRSIRRVRATSKCPSGIIRRSAMNLEASLVTPRIIGGGIGSVEPEVALALGWKGHAIYGGFMKLGADPKNSHPEATLLVRIDNRGGGSTIAHDKDDDGAVVSRAFHIPMSYLESDKGRRAFQDFVSKLLLVKATPESKADDFYAHVADFKHLLKDATQDPGLIESTYGVPHEAALPPQIAGNCVVANTFPGLCSRLGADLYNWFTKYERDLARSLVEDFADPNVLIDEQCRERDEREIKKVLDSDGPWAERLERIFSAATYAGSSDVAEAVTAAQLTKIIEAGDHRALKLLLAHGAPLETQGDRDRTPLHVAARAGEDKCVAVLLDAGANVHAMDEDGNTPLHLAILANSSPSVSRLLGKGSDRDRENREGVSPRAMIARQVDQTMLIAKSLDAEGPGGDVVPMRRNRRPFANTGT